MIYIAIWKGATPKKYRTCDAMYIKRYRSSGSCRQAGWHFDLESERDHYYYMLIPNHDIWHSGFCKLTNSCKSLPKIINHIKLDPTWVTIPRNKPEPKETNSFTKLGVAHKLSNKPQIWANGPKSTKGNKVFFLGFSQGISWFPQEKTYQNPWDFLNGWWIGWIGWIARYVDETSPATLGILSREV